MRWQITGAIICFDSTRTHVAIVFTLLPLSFRSSITVITSLGQMGVIVKSCVIWSCKYEAASCCAGGIFEVNWLAMLV